MNRDEDVLTIVADRLAWRETGEEIVVLDLQGSVYFGLNPTGARLWTMLAKGATRRALVSRLVEEQEVGPGRAADDVEAFLTVLRDEHLLTVSR